MEIKEAIKRIKECRNTPYFQPYNYTNKALNMAIEALDKQIAKTPDYEGDGYSDGQLVYDTWICPNCGEHYEVGYDHYEYCPKCGQHIRHEEWENN